MIKALKWFSALTKRLFKHPSFLLALLMIPLCVFAVKMSSKSNHGVLTIAVSSYDTEDELYKEILKELVNDNSLFNFYEASSAKNANLDVVYGKADCAWIFTDSLGDSVYNYSSLQPVELCDVVVPEETPITQLSKEKLYGILFRYLAPTVSYNYADSRVVGADKEAVYRVYNEEYAGINRDFVNFIYIDAPNVDARDADYMTSPLRGLVYVAFTVCVMAAVLLFLKDEREGRFNCFALNRRLLISFSSCFSAAIVSSVAVAASLYFADMNAGVLRELLITVLLVLSTVGFCVFLGIVFGKVKTFAYVLPTVMILMCVFCPIFVEINSFKPLQIVFPVYHALKGVYDDAALVHMVIYIAIVYPCCYLLYKLKNMFSFPAK